MTEKEKNYITLEEMRHMPLKDLAALELSALEDLQARASAALTLVRSTGSKELVFNVKLAKAWIDCALRFKRMS